MLRRPVQHRLRPVLVLSIPDDQQYDYLHLNHFQIFLLNLIFDVKIRSSLVGHSDGTGHSRRNEKIESFVVNIRLYWMGAPEGIAGFVIFWCGIVSVDTAIGVKAKSATFMNEFWFEQITAFQTAIAKYHRNLTPSPHEDEHYVKSFKTISKMHKIRNRIEPQTKSQLSNFRKW